MSGMKKQLFWTESKSLKIYLYYVTLASTTASSLSGSFDQGFLHVHVRSHTVQWKSIYPFLMSLHMLFSFLHICHNMTNIFYIMTNIPPLNYELTGFFLFIGKLVTFSLLHIGLIAAGTTEWRNHLNRTYLMKWRAQNAIHHATIKTELKKQSCLIYIRVERVKSYVGVWDLENLMNSKRGILNNNF